MLCGKSTNYPNRVAALKHPSRRYVLYLLSKQVHNAKGVIAQMEALGLHIPRGHDDFEDLTEEVLRRMRALNLPKPFEPRAAVLPVPTERWLRDHRLYDIWRGDPAVGTATELLAEPNVRHLLELLLLGPLSATAIARRVGERYGLPAHVMNPRVVRAYAHYFWDVDALDPGEWRTFIQAYCPRVAIEYKAALGAPRSRAGAAFVVALADRDPQQLSAADRYEAASTMAFSMMMQHSLHGNERATTGQTYAAFTALNMMRMADEQLTLHRGASTDLINELQRFRTIYDKRPVLKASDAEFIERRQLEEVIDVPAQR